MSWKAEKRAQRQAISWETMDCPICRGNRFTELFKKDGEPFVRGDHCGFILINPRPSYAQILDTYEPRYRQARKSVPSGRWLDIGCSAGHIVEAAKNAGYEAYGVDLESWGIEFAKKEPGLEKAFLGQLEDQKFPDHHFDVITACEVIEHEPDLHRTMKELRRLLAPAGILIIHTPDVGHRRRTRPLHKWGAVLPSEHLYYFGKKSLQRLMVEQPGLAIRKWGFNPKPGLRACAGHANGQP
jgi:2-polyprenyl-3-methyl-5-hydroxy-6-metoxy-1,4-benzoquinol methylase